MEHFKSLVLVYDWDDPTKLLWLRVRLIVRAHTTWESLLAEVRTTYEGTMVAVTNSNWIPTVYSEDQVPVQEMVTR